MRIYNKYKELILYIIFGILTTIVNLVVYYFLTLTIFDSKKAISLLFANVISWISCVGFAYITNKKFVFKSQTKITIKEALLFYKYRLFTLAIEVISMFILVNKLNFNDKIVKPIVQILIIILNYFFSKLVIFNKKKNQDIV